MLTKEELEKYFYYDESSPSCLRWKVNMYTGQYKTKINTSAGDVAGAWACSRVKSSGSWNTSLNGMKIKVHRVIYQLFHNDLTDKDYIDHLDGNPRNNKISNIRKTDHRTNMKNVKKKSNNTSGVTGVEYYERSGRSPYYVATWSDKEGNAKSKCFATSVHGLEGAFIKAVLARNEAIESLDGYTETHGRRK